MKFLPNIFPYFEIVLIKASENRNLKTSTFEISPPKSFLKILKKCPQGGFWDP